jgi:polysaccharide biosynthesis/export protein
MYKFSIIVTVIVILSAVFTVHPARAQEKAQIKEQAESQLQKMSPEEIDARIKQLGLTRAEAEAKAKEYGIDLEQYLNLQNPPPPQQQQMMQQEPSLQTSPQDQKIQFSSHPPYNSPDTSTTAVPVSADRMRSLAGSQKQTDSTTIGSSMIAPGPVPGFEGRKSADGLGLFGYNIFNFPASTFAPVLNVPTPQSYPLGPGDEVNLTMWGQSQLYLQLMVNREGEVVVPNVGPVVAQGLTIAQLKAILVSRMSSYYSGLRGGGRGADTWIDLSLGKLRSMQIFVLGEVKKPGGYAVSSMSTALLGLYVAGGPTINGSLREIQIMRDNNVVSTIDFYDFALRGDKSKDVRLQDGDVVFVKPAGKRVALAGRVIRPAIYELKKGETLADLVTLAGGLQATSYTDRVHVERIIPFNERKKYMKNILDIDVKLASVEELQHSPFPLEDGDIVSIMKINEFYQNRVTISGNVRKPGVFELSDGMRVRDLVTLADGYLPDTFEDRGNILRTLPDQRRQVIAFNLSKAMEGDSLNNPLLASLDEVTIYNKKYFFPDHPVTIGGAVRKPGTMLRAEHMKVADLLVLAGGLTENAKPEEIVVTRMDTTSESVFSQSFVVNSTSEYWQSGKGADFELKDFDYVFVPTNPHYHTAKLVYVTGEVMYPGTYAILQDGERLASIIKRAGGLKQSAYVDGARLVRQFGGAGLVPVDFKAAMEDEKDAANIEVVEGDQIMIDKNPRVVYVRGEVGVPSAVVFEPGASLDYYLDQAGGVKDAGDETHAIVIQPNGRKWKSSWFFEPNSEILAGATITVPAKVEHESKTLPLLRDWATVFASLATMMVVIVQITK